MFKFIFFFFILSSLLYCAFDYNSFSAASISIGESSFIEDGMSSLYNPSFMPSKLIFSSFYSNLYSMDLIYIKAFSFCFPSKIGTIGIGFSDFGIDGLYKENIFVFAYKYRFGNISFGASLKDLNLQIIEMSQETNVFSSDIGFNVDISKKSNLGFLMSNFTKPTIGQTYKEQINSNMQFGYSYYFYNNCRAILEILKNFDNRLNYKCGFEFNLLNKLLFRCGYQNTNIVSLGFGINVSKFIFDYALILKEDFSGNYFGFSFYY